MAPCGNAPAHSRPNVPAAYSYSRVSTGEQASGGGLSRQGDMASAWCVKNDYTLDTTLDLSDPGRSAYKGDHVSKGALGRFLQLAQQRKLGDHPVLLIETVDRLSRQEPLEVLDTILLELVKRAGVTIIDLEDGQEYSRATLNTDPLALVKFTLKAQAAHDFSKRLGRRLSAHWQQTYDGFRSGARSHRGGKGGRHPHWLQLDPSTQRWIVLPEKAATVTLIFELLQSRGLSLTAEELNRRGLLSPAGKQWSSDGVKRTATDPAVYGALRLSYQPYLTACTAHRRWLKAKATAEKKGQPFTDPEPHVPELELLDNFYPPLITAEQFHLTQQLIQQRRHLPASKGDREDGGLSLFQGMVRCELGGSVGVTHSNPQRSAPRHYLRCRSRLNGRRCSCSGKGWHLPDITAHILRRLGRGVLTHAATPAASTEHDVLQQKINAATGRLNDARAALARARRSLDEAIDAGASITLLERLNTAVDDRMAEESKLLEALSALELEQAARRNKPTPDQLIATPAIALMRGVLGGTASADERRALQSLFRGIGLKVTLDGSDRENPVVWLAADGIEPQPAPFLGDAEPGLLALDTLIQPPHSSTTSLHIGREISGGAG